MLFQSTLPARGATSLALAGDCVGGISIHAPRTGSDLGRHQRGIRRVYFNPRSPHGERPSGSPPCSYRMRISIHAPRTGSDSALAIAYRAVTHFNPRSPHGERQHGLPLDIHAKYFNPRSPHGERRCRRIPAPTRRRYFNPRSPHGERRGCLRACQQQKDFNPRSPHGERLSQDTSSHAPPLFQSTLPARGAT